MEEIVERMVENKKPFLLIKYGITAFNGVACNAYDVVTLGTTKLQYLPIERKVALKIIDKHDLPLLHKLDSRNEVWGDEKFREQFKERGLKV